MTDRIYIPMPGIGTLSLTRAEYEAALIPIAPPVTPISPNIAPLRPLISLNHETSTSDQGLRYIRLKEVCARVGLCRSAIYDLINDGRFPKQVKLSERTSAWVVSEVETYMDARVAERDRYPVTEPSSPYMRMGEVMRVTGLNSSKLYDLIRRGEFPKWAPLPKIATGWVRTEIQAWLASHDSI